MRDNDRRRGGEYDEELIVRQERQEAVAPNGGLVGQDVTVAEHIDRVGARRDTADWIGGLIAFIIGALAILLAIRLVLKLLAANPDSGFTRFVYGLSNPFVAPFQGIIGTPSAGGGAIFETATLLAIAIYLLLGWGLTRLIHLILDRPASGASATRTVGRNTRL